MNKVRVTTYHYRRNCRVSKYGISLNPNEGHVSIIDNRIKIEVTRNEILYFQNDIEILYSVNFKN